MAERLGTLRGSLGDWIGALLRGAHPAPPTDFMSSLVEHMADAVAACDADGNIILLNRRAREGADGFPAHVHVPAGLRREQWSEYFQLYRPGATELLPTEELPLVRALRGETVRDMRLETHGESDARAVINVSGGPIRGEDDAILGAVVVIQDATEQFAAESRRELGSAVATNVALGVGMVSATSGEIVYANEQWERLFGYAPGELAGRHVSVINAPTHLSPEERAQEIFDALERQGTWEGEFRNVRKDGSELWTYAHISRFEHPEHGTLWITASADISERKAGETEVHAAAERFRAVFEDAPTGIALVGTDRQLIDANKLLCKMLGWHRDDLVGRPLTTIVHPQDQDVGEDLAARVLAGELPRYRVEKRYQTRGGEPLPVTETATVLRAADDRPLLWITFVEESHPNRMM